MFSPHSPHADLFQAFIDRKILDAIARKRTQNTTVDWEDAAQVAYEKLWQVTQQGKFRTDDPDGYCHWAATVTYHAILDYVKRRENRQQYDSLDQLVPGTNLTLLDTLVDEFDALDAIDQADLLLDVIAIITELDRRYPKRRYLQIWQGLVQGKKQVQIADELKTDGLKIDQSSISDRWKEIRRHVAEIYPEFKAHQRQNQNPNQRRKSDRGRSPEQW